MTQSTDSPLAALLLTNRLTPVETKPFSAGQFWKLVAAVPRLEDLLTMDPDAIQETAGIDPEEALRVRTLLDATRAFAFERERLEEAGMALISAVEDRFPSVLLERLGTNCPPFLIIAGPIERLSDGGLSIAGSRNASEEALDATRSAAVAAVDHGWPVITGLAKGVDQAAIEAAAAAGGLTVGIPAEGINVVSRRSAIRQLVHDGQLCIASPYAPGARFSAGTAMGRNKIIYALSTVAFVASADRESGGTWTGAVETLKRGWCPVTTWTGPGARDGNTGLVDKGAHVITQVDQIFDPALLEAQPKPPRPTLF